MNDPVAAGHSAEAEIGDRGEVIVLADDRFDAIFLRADHALVLVRTGGPLGELFDAVAEVPDALLLALRIEIDDGDFFRRWQRRHGPARLHMKAQMAVLAPGDVRTEKARMFGVIKIGQRTGF